MGKKEFFEIFKGFEIIFFNENPFQAVLKRYF